MSRRHAFLPVFILVLGLLPGLAAPARAAMDTATATGFVRSTGSALVGAINGPGSAEAKSQALAQIVDSKVAVDAIAKFCLGRFWRVATPAQRTQYQQLFHRVLVLNVTAKIGDYQGVTFKVGRAVPRAEGVMVATTVIRPGQAPAEVDWLVREVDGAPKIIDVVAEGTSLRVTQRSDYASFITHHNDSVAALITALRAQAARAG
jgi:phospholipid transport system substrate-binding protein